MQFYKVLLCLLATVSSASAFAPALILVVANVVAADEVLFGPTVLNKNRQRSDGVSIPGRGRLNPRKNSKKNKFFSSLDGSPIITTGPTETPINASMIPICKLDPLGNNNTYLALNDPRYNDPDITTKVSTNPDLTVASGTDAVEKISAALNVLAAIGGVGDLVTTSDPTSDLVTTSATFFKGLGATGAIAGATLSALTVFGVIPGSGPNSGPSPELLAISEVSRAMQAGFSDLQVEIRKQSKEVIKLLSDIALDELFSRLDAVGYAFNDYVAATPEERAALYDANFRAACNDPITMPRNIFFILYGYMCEDCTHASRKRANLYKIAMDENDLSGTLFLNNHARPMLLMLAQAMFLHSVCLPPIQGSCVDKTAENSTFQRGLDIMVKASSEVLYRVNETAIFLNDWVPNLDLEPLNLEFPIANYDGAASNILAFLESKQPDYIFWVSVLPKNDNKEFEKVARRKNSCKTSKLKIEGAVNCITAFDTTGQIYFEDISQGEGDGDPVNIDIRYVQKKIVDTDAVKYPERNRKNEMFERSLLNELETLRREGTFVPFCSDSTNLAIFKERYSDSCRWTMPCKFEYLACSDPGEQRGFKNVCGPRYLGDFIIYKFRGSGSGLKKDCRDASDENCAHIAISEGKEEFFPYLELDDSQERSHKFNPCIEDDDLYDGGNKKDDGKFGIQLIQEKVEKELFEWEFRIYFDPFLSSDNE